MAASASTVTDPYLQAYYNMQTQNVVDNYGMQKGLNDQAKAMSDLSFNQKQQALDEKLNGERNTFEDPYASRGLLNSGIYNWNGPMDANGGLHLGAQQMFGHNMAEAEGNLATQKTTTDQAYSVKNQQLANSDLHQLQGIQTIAPSDQTRAAISDAISAGGV